MIFASSRPDRITLETINRDWADARSKEWRAIIYRYGPRKSEKARKAMAPAGCI